MTIKANIRSVAAALVIGLCFPYATRAAQPNILFIFSDDQRSDLVGVQNPKIYTPHLDALANSGVRFMNACATTSICSPARAAVLTGRYGSANGVTGLDASIHKSERTFANYLKSAGYRTAHFGKWHIVNSPDEVGFDDFASIYSNGSWFDRKLKYNNVKGCPNQLGGVFYEKFMADQVINYISNHVSHANSPFVIWWCNQVPHLDGSHRYPASQTSLNRYAVSNMPVPASWEDDLVGKPPYLASSRFITASGQFNYGGPGGFTNLAPGIRNAHLGQDNVQQHNKEYYASVTDLDNQVGRVLAALADPNGDGSTKDSIVTNTWIIFMSDNGWQTGSHKLTSKVLSYDESMRVPLLVRGPGVTPRLDTNLVLNIDVTKIILDLAGVATPTNLHGLNLRALIANPATPWRERVYHESISTDLDNQPHRALRTHRYKYIHTFGANPAHEELYDLAQDPLELTNLIHAAPYATVKANMVRWLQEEVNAVTHARP